MTTEEIREEYNQKWLEAKRELSILAYELAVWLNGYLTEQFICDPEELPIDECLDETLTIIRRFHSQGIRLPTGESLVEEERTNKIFVSGTNVDGAGNVGEEVDATEEEFYGDVPTYNSLEEYLEANK